MAQSTVIVKLSLKDAEVVKRGLQAVGADGEKALKRIEAAGRAPSAGLKALGAASDELKGKLGNMAGSAGSVGTALQALGPGGLAAAAGIGAIALALVKVMNAAREVIAHFDQMADRAEQIGLSAEHLQELNYGFTQAGVGVEQLEGALIRLNDNIGKVLQDGADAPKEIKQAFDALGITMADVQKHGDDLNWMVRAIAEGMAGLTTQAERTTVAKALMGKEAAKLVPALQGGAKAIDDMAAAAHEAGAVVGDELVSEYGKLGDRLDAASQVLQTQAGRIFPEAAAAATRYAEEVAGASAAVADFLDDVRQELGPNVFQEITNILFNMNAPGGPLILVWNSVNAILERMRLIGNFRGAGATGSWGGGETGSWDGPLPSPVARPTIAMPRGSGRGGWPEGGKGKGGKKKAGKGKAPEYVDMVTGKATTPTENQLYFLAHPPEPRRFQDLEAFEEAADGIEKRNTDLMASLQRAWLQSSDQRIALIQLDRDAAIKALDEQELSEEQHAQAVSLIRQTAGAEIVTEARRLVETTDKTTEATYKLSDTFQGFGQVASSAFEDAIVKGGKFSDMLNGLAEDIQRLLIRNTLNKFLDIAINAGGAALTGWLGGGTTTPTVQQHQANIQNILRGGGTTNALGNAFDHGNVIPFARGGVVSRPTLFPMARGMGLMGEAGPEAVVPLKRMPSGNLGVEGTAGGVTVNIINNTPSKVTTEEKKGDPKGGVNLNVVIDSLETAMAQRLQRPGSQLNRAMAQAANPIKAR